MIVLRVAFIYAQDSDKELPLTFCVEKKKSYKLYNISKMMCACYTGNGFASVEVLNSKGTVTVK